MIQKNCLVIGGGGYIGSHLVPILLSTGRKVTILGRSPSPLFPIPDQADYIEGSYAQPELIRTLLDNHQEIIHLAYASVPNTSFDNPLSDLLQNLPPAIQLFIEIAARGGRLILVSSGGTVYGEALQLPISETHPTHPISPYGVTKLTLEKYAHLYMATHGLRVICIRPANAFGEGQRPFAGQGFIATAIASIIQNQPIIIFGEKGTIRDYLHVEDLANGIALALDHGQHGAVYNLGSGIGRSNFDVLETITTIFKQKERLQVIRKPLRPFDVRANVLDSSLFARHTGWQPRIKFEDGILRTYQSLIDHFHFQQVGQM